MIAAVWLVVGIAVAAMPLSRLRHMLRGPGGAGITVEERERARDQALEAVRESLGALASAVAEEAQARVVSAVVPSADGLVDAGEDILEASEDLVDDLVDDVPGGGVVGQVIDVALIPGRFGVRVEPRCSRAVPRRRHPADRGALLDVVDPHQRCDQAST